MLIGRPRNQQSLAASPSGGLNGNPSVRSGTGRCFNPSPVKTKRIEFKFSSNPGSNRTYMLLLLRKNYKRNLANHNEPRLHLREEIQVNRLKKEKNTVDTRHTSSVVLSSPFFQINGSTLGVEAAKCPAKLTRKLTRNNRSCLSFDLRLF